ncbi:MAG: hypothetical protein JOZ03_02645 [Gammaproteobacteria bacterium]|nr:hypothetical protein [Gammaproteobacteria bacterium]
MRAALGALLALAAPPYAAAASHPPREYLDEETAATVTVVDEPLVFAFARRDLAANARDYVTLAPAAVNRMGTVSYVLIAYFWSTIDPRLREDTPAAATQVTLLADDRQIELHPKGSSAHEAGIGMAVHAPPGMDAHPEAYATDLSVIRFLAESRHLALRMDTGNTVLDYELWEDRRPALRDFVRHMNGED